MRAVRDEDVDRPQVHNGDVQPSGTNSPIRFSVRCRPLGGVAARSARAPCVFRVFPACQPIEVATARGSHPFPSRTGQLSPAAPMVLPQGGRVGRRRFFPRGFPSRRQRLREGNPLVFVALVVLVVLVVLACGRGRTAPPGSCGGGDERGKAGGGTPSAFPLPVFSGWMRLIR